LILYCPPSNPNAKDWLFNSWKYVKLKDAKSYMPLWLFSNPNNSCICKWEVNSVAYWPMWSTDPCGPLTHVVYWPMWPTVPCGLLTHVAYWPMWSTDPCDLLTHVVYWPMWPTDPCGPLTHITYCPKWPPNPSITLVTIWAEKRQNSFLLPLLTSHLHISPQLK